MVHRGIARDDNVRLVYSTGQDAPGDADRAPRQSQATRRERGPGVRIRIERRGSGRLVTLVSGIPGPVAALAELARSLKTCCGTGGSVKDAAIELQGDQRDAVEAELRRRGHKPKRAGGQNP
jgi:translation initiation factor 1